MSEPSLPPPPPSIPPPPPPGAEYFTGAPATTTTAPGTAPSPAKLLVLGGAGLSIIGSFMPWAEVSIEGFGILGGVSTTASGMDGDGGITLVLSLATLGLFAGYLRRAPRTIGLAIGAIVSSVLVTLVALVDIGDVQNEFGDGTSEFDLGIEVSIGYGLWMVLVGGLAAIAGTAWSLARP